MERKVRLMKVTSLAAFFISIAVALAFSGMAAFLKWGCVAIMVAATINMLMKKTGLDRADERELYVEHVAGWVSGILTMVVVNIFIILDALKTGHFDEKLFSLVSIWGLSRVIVVKVMGGGHGKVNQ